MSMAANKLFLDSLRTGLSDLMTAAALETAMDRAARILTEYDIERTVIDDPGKDYMLDAYLDAMKVEGKSVLTLKRYSYELHRMLKAMGVSSCNVSAYHVRKYLADEKARGICDNSIRSIYQVLNSYFGWLHRDGLIRIDPMVNISTPKVPKKVMEVYSELDLEKLKEGCTNIRDKAIVLFLKSSGCRISEITNLNRDDIDFQRGEFIVLGKGNKQRTCYMDMITASVLKEYLNSRTDAEPCLFLGCRNERRMPDGIRYMLRNLGAQCGVAHVHPHKFRRTEATALSRRGMPIEQVQRFLGHEKIDTTMKYVNIDNADVKNNYRRYA